MSSFEKSFSEKAAEINAIAKQHGFWTTEYGNGEKIALMHSELSEALESLRCNNPPDKHCPNFTSVEIELADCVIRIMDFAYQKKLRLAQAILVKTEFNKTRPFKHNKKF